MRFLVEWRVRSALVVVFAAVRWSCGVGCACDCALFFASSGEAILPQSRSNRAGVCEARTAALALAACALNATRSRTLRISRVTAFHAHVSNGG